MVVAASALAMTACTDSSPAATTFETASSATGATIVELEASGRLADSDAVVHAVAVGPLELVAVGQDAGQSGISGDEAAAVWVSTDGSTWNRVETDPSFVDGGMTDVVWYQAESVYVAVGTHVSHGAVWQSADGYLWTRVALFAFSNPPGAIEVDSVVASSSGLLAIGREWLAEGTAIPAEWTSQDAVSWEGVLLADGHSELTLAEWMPVAQLPMSVSSGAVVEAVDTGIVVLQTDSTTLIPFDGTMTNAPAPPLHIPPGCCGSVVVIPVREQLVLADPLSNHLDA